MSWKDKYPKQSNLVKLVLEQGGTIKPLIIPGDQIGGTGLCNPSVYIDKKEGILVNIRHVGYTMYHTEFDHKYWSIWGCMVYVNPEDFVYLETNNYLCKLDKDLNIKQHNKINTAKHDIEPLWEFIGLEDARIVRWDNKLYSCGVRRDTETTGIGRMELSEIEYWGGNTANQTFSYSNNENKITLNEITRDRIEVPDKETYLEKNWAPILDMPYHFVKWTNPLEIVKVNPKQKTSEVVIQKNKHQPLEECDLRGGSQVISYNDYYICVVHECYFPPKPDGVGNGKDAHYYHRFVFWDKDWNLVKISKKFKFMDTMIEFVCGLAEYQGDLLITFGYQDNASYILKMPFNTLNKLEYENIKN